MEHYEPRPAGNSTNKNRSFPAHLYGHEEPFEITLPGNPWKFVKYPNTLDTEQSSTPSIYGDAIVIATDGACRNSDQPSARAAYGVYVHDPIDDGQSWNRSGKLEERHAQTNDSAALRAGLEGLSIALEIRKLNPEDAAVPPDEPNPTIKLSRVVIKSDSEYLVKAETIWIYNWLKGDHHEVTNACGGAIRNQELFQGLEDTIEELNNLGVQVQLHHVSGEQNRVADCLANAALDGIEADEALRRFVHA